jgi:YVTN family beta-propeller protein
MSMRSKSGDTRGQLIGLAVACGFFALTAAAFYSLSSDPVTAAEKNTDKYAARTMPLQYASPLETIFSADGKKLFVLCNESNEVRVVDVATGKETKRIAVGNTPRGMTYSADGTKLLVTNTNDDTVSLIDVHTLNVVGTWAVGFEPSGIVAEKSGKFVYVANRISNDVAVLDAKSGAVVKRLVAGRGASYLEATPDGKRIYATHVYPNPSAYRTGPESEIAVIDAVSARVIERMPMHRIAGVFHVAFSKDGKLGAVAEYHPKNLVPLAHLEHSGAFVYTLTLFGEDIGRQVEIPLDEMERYSSQPFAIAITPDKSRLYVSCGGTDIVLAIDLRKLVAYIHAHPEDFTEDLSASSNYVIARIPVGRNPRGLTLSPDGTKLYAANRLDDTISVIDTRTSRVSSTIKLDTPAVVSALRKGEQTFYTARQSFQGQIGCANCHIDSTFDGLTWDLEPDGFGRDIVDNRMIEDLRDTEPYKWIGTNPNIPTECGPRTEKYFWRSENYDDLTLSDLTIYIRSIPQRPHRWRQPGGELTQAQQRGYALFTRSKDKFGAEIVEYNRCAFCHSGPKGTNKKVFDVGTKKTTDNRGDFDTPQLTNIALTAPYLHDGSAPTLEEIWTVFNPEDKHGRTNDLTKDELNDLIEYLRTR